LASIVSFLTIDGHDIVKTMFGFQPKYETSKIVYMPIPWETTTSYGGGTSRGPEAIIKASRQIDERDPVLKGVFEQGLFMMPENPEIKSWQNQAISSNSKEVANSMGAKLNELVFQETEKLFSEKKIPGLVGGDHSIAFGGIKAASRHFKKNFGLLHFDAHLDFRKAYQGYTWSHASILFNIMENCDAVSKLIQVGTRDFCDEEITYLESLGPRARAFHDHELSERQFG
jgi:agmatinase